MKKFRIKIENKEYIVEVEELDQQGQSNTAPSISQKPVKTISKEEPSSKTNTNKNESQKAVKEKVSESTSSEEIKAPMPGKILKVMVNVGDEIADGEPVLILEAMKMENEIYASANGKVKKVNVNINDMVDTGDTLIIIG